MRNRLLIVLLLGLSACTHSIAPVSNDNGPLREVWKTPRSGAARWHTETDPIIEGGRIYMTFDSTVACLDTGTGRMIWAKGYSAQVNLLEQGLLFEENNNLYVQVGGKDFYCLDANSGFEHWHFTDAQTLTIRCAEASNAIYVDEGLAGFRLLALSKATGQVLWHIDTIFPASGDSSDYFLSAPFISDGRIYVSGNVGYFGGLWLSGVPSVIAYSAVASFNPVSGARIWERDFRDSGPTSNDGHLWLNSNNTLLADKGDSLLTLDSNGNTLRVRASGLPDKPLHQNGLLYGSLSNSICAIDEGTGATNWTSPVNGVDYFGIQADQISDNLFYALTHENLLVGYDLLTGTTIRTIDLKPYCVNDSSAVEAIHIDGNRIYFADRDYVRCLEVR